MSILKPGKQLKPFQSGFSSANGQRNVVKEGGGEGAEQVPVLLFRWKKFQGSQRNSYQGKINRRAYLFSQQIQNFIHRTQRRPNKSPPSGKKFVCRKNNPNSAISRSIKAFPVFLENVHKKSRHFICRRRLQNTFLHKTTSEKVFNWETRWSFAQPSL